MILTRALTLIAFSLFCFRVFPGLRRRFAFRPRVIKPVLSYGFWVMISNAISPILVYLDRFLVGTLLTVTAVTFYTAPYEAVTRLGILPYSLLITLFPMFSALNAGGEEERKGVFFQKAVKFLLLSMGFVIVVLIFFARDLIRIYLGPEFAAASAIVFQWIAFGFLLNTLATVPYGYLQGMGRSDLVAKFYVAELVLYVPLAWLLIKAGQSGRRRGLDDPGVRRYDPDVHGDAKAGEDRLLGALEVRVGRATVWFGALAFVAAGLKNLPCAVRFSSWPSRSSSSSFGSRSSTAKRRISFGPDFNGSGPGSRGRRDGPDGTGRTSRGRHHPELERLEGHPALPRFLSGLDYPDFRVTVVDNGSTDDSVDRLEAWRRDNPRRLDFTLIRTGENLGFAGGNNVGIREALKTGADFVWLLNNDTVVDPRSLTELVDLARADASTGVVGSLILDQRSPEKISSAGSRSPGMDGGPVCSDCTGIDRRRNSPAAGKSTPYRPARFCAGVKPNRTGLLDERYFLDMEDVVLCTRLRQDGFIWRVAPRASSSTRRELHPGPSGAGRLLPRPKPGPLHQQVLYPAFTPPWTRSSSSERVSFCSSARSVRLGNLGCLRAFRLGRRHGSAARYDYRFSPKDAEKKRKTPKKRE